jgi:hypothetical protein
VTVGSGAVTANISDTAVGVNAKANTTDGSAFGFNAQANGTNSSAFGANAFAAGPSDTAIGSNAHVGADFSTAVGAGATIAATSPNSTAIGAGATVATNAPNSVAIGSGSIATQANTVSFGTPQDQRRLTNVADGVNGSDAANMRQLRKAYGGVGMSMANEAVSLNLDVGEMGVTGGIATFEGQQALGLRYEYRANDQVSVGVGVAGSNGGGGTWGATAGVGYKW